MLKDVLKDFVGQKVTLYVATPGGSNWFSGLLRGVQADHAVLLEDVHGCKQLHLVRLDLVTAATVAVERP